LREQSSLSLIAAFSRCLKESVVEHPQASADAMLWLLLLRPVLRVEQPSISGLTLVSQMAALKLRSIVP